MVITLATVILMLKCYFILFSKHSVLYSE